jgi:hypothetical protein
MLSRGLRQFEYDVAQVDWVATVQLGSAWTQLAKSLIFCRSASEQLLLLNAVVHESLLNGMLGNVPQAAYFPGSALSALPTLSQVLELEFELPHPAASSSKVVARAILVMGPPLSAGWLITQEDATRRQWTNNKM